MPFSLLAIALPLAGQIMPARPLGIRAWIGEGEYPTVALRNAERGFFIGHISISPEGMPEHCEPIQRSKLSEATCNILLEKSRFEPARDA